MNVKRQLFKIYKFEGYKALREYHYKCINCTNRGDDVTTFEISEENFKKYPYTINDKHNLCIKCNQQLYTTVKPIITMERINAHFKIKSVEAPLEKLVLPEQRYFMDEPSKYYFWTKQ